MKGGVPVYRAGILRDSTGHDADVLDVPELLAAKYSAGRVEKRHLEGKQIGGQIMGRG